MAPVRSAGVPIAGGLMAPDGTYAGSRVRVLIVSNEMQDLACPNSAGLAGPREGVLTV